jgi:carboxymethylenebutenolidase
MPRAWPRRSSIASRRSSVASPSALAGRREFLRRVSLVAGCVPASLLAMVGSSAAQATEQAKAQVTIPSEFDTSLESVAVAFRGSPGMTLGYSSQPKASGARPGLILFHDVGGLSPRMRGVARYLATSGYAVLAPDFLSPQGGTASFRGVDADVQRAVGASTAAAMAAQASGALTYAKSHGGSGGRGFALVGFGWGGTQALLFAAGRTDIAACVAFYPDPAHVIPVLPKLTAPMLAIFAAEDPATKASVEQFERAATSPRRTRTVKIFPEVTRGFHDPAETKVYKPETATQAFALVIQHLDAHTKGTGTAGA